MGNTHTKCPARSRPLSTAAPRSRPRKQHYLGIVRRRPLSAAGAEHADITKPRRRGYPRPLFRNCRRRRASTAPHATARSTSRSGAAADEVTRFHQVYNIRIMPSVQFLSALSSKGRGGGGRAHSRPSPPAPERHFIREIVASMNQSRQWTGRRFRRFWSTPRPMPGRENWRRFAHAAGNTIRRSDADAAFRRERIRHPACRGQPATGNKAANSLILWVAASAS